MGKAPTTIMHNDVDSLFHGNISEKLSMPNDALVWLFDLKFCKIWMISFLDLWSSSCC